MVVKCLLFLVLLALAVNAKRKLTTVYEWKDLEFGFPTEEDKQEAIKNGSYIRHNGFPVDVDVYQGANNVQRVFITIPRITTGIPFSLATVSHHTESINPVLEAYPSYEVHKSQGDDCNGITSIHRVIIDECQRLWMVDAGTVNNVPRCPPQVMVYTLEDNNLLFRYRFPDGQFLPGVTQSNTPVVDIKYHGGVPQCHQAKLYIADVKSFGLIVFDSETKTSWRIENELMNPDLKFRTFTIANESVELWDGIVAMSLTPRTSLGERFLYFHALTSDTENRVSLRAINNASMWLDPKGHPEVFQELGHRGVQCVSEAIDSRGNIYCGPTDPISIFAWNIKTPYEKKYFKNIVTDSERLQFSTGMKVISNRKGGQDLWILTNRLQKIYTGTINYDDVNFRVMVINRL